MVRKNIINIFFGNTNKTKMFILTLQNLRIKFSGVASDCKVPKILLRDIFFILIMLLKQFYKMVRNYQHAKIRAPLPML